MYISKLNVILRLASNSKETLRKTGTPQKFLRL